MLAVVQRSSYRRLQPHSQFWSKDTRSAMSWKEATPPRWHSHGRTGQVVRNFS